MIRNFFLVTLRTLMKNKLYIFINIFGMSIAIGCCIVAYFNYEFDATYDDCHQNAGRVYRVSSLREFSGQTELFGLAPMPMGPVIRENIADAQKVTRYHYSYSNFKKGDDLFPSNLAYVDPDFFDMFTFNMVKGSKESIVDKSTVFLSEEAAIRLYGTIDVIGNVFTQIYGTQQKEVVVGGVFEQPAPNNSFRTEAFMNYENFFDEFEEGEQDWKFRNTVFVQIDDPQRVDQVEKQLQPYTEPNNKVREDFIIAKYVLDPFVGMARRDSANDTNSMTWEASPVAAVIGPTMMAVFVLLIACFNLTNTSIAVSSRRLKEIGIRKVMGSQRFPLVMQFLGETLFICFIALLLGLLLGEVLLAAWNALWVHMKLTSHYTDNSAFLFFMIGVLAFTGLIAGGYPAFYVSRFEPVNILKGRLKFGGTNYFTKILLVLQFAISVIAIIHAIAFVQNAKYQRDFDLGFDQKGVIISYINNLGEFETYRNLLAQNPDIVSIAGSNHSIYSSRYNDPVKVESRQLEVDILDVGDNYIKTMGLTLVAGRDFIKDSESDHKESVIITEKMAESFGWKEPLGKQLTWMDTVQLYVVGVVRDVYTNGLWREMEPLMMRYARPEKYSHLIVSAPINKIAGVNAFMEKRWKEAFPNRLYNGRMIGVEAAEATTVNNNILKMFIFMGLVAMILSSTGLFSLVSLNIIKRMKEIGVRKVLGATVFNITRIINTEVVLILVIASLLGSAAAYVLVDSLMDSIWDYYQSATAITFVASTMLLFGVSALTIGYKIYQAATMNPVNTLRDE